VVASACRLRAVLSTLPVDLDVPGTEHPTAVPAIRNTNARHDDPALSIDFVIENDLQSGYRPLGRSAQAGQEALERYGLTTIVAAPVIVMESATTRVPTVGSPELPPNVSGAAAA